MTTSVSRRGFLGQMALAGAAAALARSPELIPSVWLETAHAAGADLLHDTYNGLMAFVVPGPDEYSMYQGVSTTEPGGIDAGGVDALIATIDESTPYFPNFAAFVAAILNGIASQVHPGISGPFASPFACLSAPEKAIVFQVMDTSPIDQLKVIAGVLPAFVAFFGYSEAGSFDPASGSLTSTPVGWTISNYRGVADGRDEFLGYLEGNHHA